MSTFTTLKTTHRFARKKTMKDIKLSFYLFNAMMFTKSLFLIRVSYFSSFSTFDHFQDTKKRNLIDDGSGLAKILTSLRSTFVRSHLESDFGFACIKLLLGKLTFVFD